MVITLLSQLFGIWLEENSYMDRAEEMMDRNSISAVQFAEQHGKISISNGYQSIWFEGPISLCAATLILYIFLIWYKEWFGKSTFAYRLLMLPTTVHDILMKGNPENLSIRYIGDDLYLTLMSESSESRVLQYQLVENKLKHDVKLTLQEWQTQWGRAHNTQIANNRLYMLALGRKDPGVVIADLDTGKIVYQGVIEGKDELGSNRLSFENISVR